MPDLVTQSIIAVLGGLVLLLVEYWIVQPIRTASVPQSPEREVQFSWLASIVLFVTGVVSFAVFATAVLSGMGFLQIVSANIGIGENRSTIFSDPNVALAIGIYSGVAFTLISRQRRVRLIRYAFATLPALVLTIWMLAFFRDNVGGIFLCLVISNMWIVFAGVSIYQRASLITPVVLFPANALILIAARVTSPLSAWIISVAWGVVQMGLMTKLLE